MTRKDSILRILRERRGEWVDGAEFIGVETGGIRYGARIEELRQEGHKIESQRSPNPRKAVWQYRIVEDSGTWYCTSCMSTMPASEFKGVSTVAEGFQMMGCSKCKSKRVWRKKA